MKTLNIPFKQIEEWLEEAKRHPQIAEPTAFALATANKQGQPSLRILLLKGLDERGLTFFTNSESQKGSELRENPQACINFYWMPLGRQIRATGKVEPVSAEESNIYFASRRRGSQIGAWASDQSRPLDDCTTLEKRVAELEKQYEGKEIPRPPHWYGWRLIPDSIEFWQEGEFRLHHREVYLREGAGWRKELRYP